MLHEHYEVETPAPTQYNWLPELWDMLPDPWEEPLFNRCDWCSLDYPVEEIRFRADGAHICGHCE